MPISDTRDRPILLAHGELRPVGQTYGVPELASVGGDSVAAAVDSGVVVVASDLDHSVERSVVVLRALLLSVVRTALVPIHRVITSMSLSSSHSSPDWVT